MQIAHLQSDIAQIIGKIFGGAFRQCRDQNALVFLHPLPAKLNRFIDLILQRLDRNSWIEQTSRSNNLLNHERRPGRMRIAAP